MISSFRITSALRWISLPLNNHRNALAAAYAEGRETSPHVPPTHFVKQSHKHAGAARPYRVAERDGAAVDVDARRIQSELTRNGQALRRESFVQLEQVDIL